MPDPKQPMAGGDFNYTKTSKRSPFDGGLRTPILIRWDGHTKAGTHQNPCSSVDVVPTLLDALGIENVDVRLPGRSLWPSATGIKQLAAVPVFGAIYPGDASALGHPERDVAYRWIRSGRFKLVVPYVRSGENPWGHYLDKVALFDAVADPHEQVDLADDERYVDSIERLKQQLDQWWTPTNKPE